MLQAARAKLKEGVDVVVGVVETHGRKETEALLEGFEVLPRKPTIYVNRILERVRHRRRARSGGRASILVDELAHTNVPGSRHPKRYLDVEELLDAGIDVYTTVNIQHIESLNDVVAQITRVRVRETVPDADPRPRRRHRARRPDARRPDPAPEGGQGLRPQAGRARAQALLLARQPDGAARAGAAPHRRARRRAAARAHAGARHLRALGGGRAHSRLRQRGSALRRRWCATPSGWRTACARPGRRSTSRRARSLQLGEERARPHRRDAAAGRAARRRGRHRARRGAQRSPTTSSATRARTTSRTSSSASPTRSRWFEIVHGSVVHDLVRRAGNISVHVIAGEELAEQSPAQADGRDRMRPQPFDPLPYIVALLAVAAALGVGMLVRPAVRHRERRPRLPDGDRRRRRALRAVAVAAGQRRRPRSPTTSSSCRRSTPSPSPIRPTSPPSCCSPCSAIVVSNLPRAAGRRP